MSRTLRDTALFWSVLADRPLAVSPEPLPLRIALSVEHWAGASPDPLVVGATETAAQQFEQQGHRVSFIEQPVDNDQLMSTWHVLFSRWVARDVASLEKATGRRAGPDTLEPLTLVLLEEVAQLTVADIGDAQVEQGRITRRLERAMAPFDVLVTPTLGRPTIPLETLAGEVESMDEYLRLNDETFPFSFLFNVAGGPALSVPVMNPAEDGLPAHPLGVQLVGRPGTERMLMTLAEQLS